MENNKEGYLVFFFLFSIFLDLSKGLNWCIIFLPELFSQFYLLQDNRRTFEDK